MASLDVVGAVAPGQRLLHRALLKRIGGREAMWRVRAGAEGPRRAAAGASKAARRAGTREGATPWGTPLPWPPSLEERGWQLGRVDSGCARFSTTPAGVVPGPGACVGSPRCSNIERTSVGAVTSASTFRLPPHRGQANTSSAKVLRSSPAQSTRAVLCFLGSSTVAARQRLSFCGPASVPA